MSVLRAQTASSGAGSQWHRRKLASRNLMMFGCSNVRWFTISRSTFLSICKQARHSGNPHALLHMTLPLELMDRSKRHDNDAQPVKALRQTDARACKFRSGAPAHVEAAVTRNPWSVGPSVGDQGKGGGTLSPRSINLTATSSPVGLYRISLATPKLPLPISLSCNRMNKDRVVCMLARRTPVAAS